MKKLNVKANFTDHLVQEALKQISTKNKNSNKRNSLIDQQVLNIRKSSNQYSSPKSVRENSLNTIASPNQSNNEHLFKIKAIVKKKETLNDKQKGKLEKFSNIILTTLQKKNLSSSIPKSQKQIEIATPKSRGNSPKNTPYQNIPKENKLIPTHKRTQSLKKNTIRVKKRNKSLNEVQLVKKCGQALSLKKRLDLNKLSDENQYSQSRMQMCQSPDSVKRQEYSFDKLLNMSPQTNHPCELINFDLDISLDDNKFQTERNAVKCKTTLCSPKIRSPKSFKKKINFKNQNKFRQEMLRSPVQTDQLIIQNTNFDFKQEIRKVSQLRQMTLNICNSLGKEKQDQKQNLEVDEKKNEENEKIKITKKTEILKEFQQFIEPLIQQIENFTLKENIPAYFKKDFMHLKI